MPSKGLAKCSWQKGSLDLVQISVSYSIAVSYAVQRYQWGKGEEKGEKIKTYRLESLLNLSGQRATLEGNDGSGLRVVGDGGAALLAEPAPDGVAGVGGALPLLDGAVDLELVLEDYSNKGCFVCQLICV